MKLRLTPTAGLIIFLSALTFNSFGQRKFEKLDRSVVALKTNTGVYVNWRIPSEEWYNVSYNLYRDGTLLNSEPITGASNFTDVNGTVTSAYTVTSIKNGIESIHSKVANVINAPFLEIKMRDLPDSLNYQLNDATAADLDGDGEYEIIVKRLNNDFTNLTTDRFSYFEAYKLDGTFLWAIDVGPNIINDVEINIMAFDFDGDGKAEVLMRSSEGTVDGKGNKISDTDGDGRTNYRSTGIRINNSPFMIEGPEFLSLYNGETGEELDRVNFIARAPLAQWGTSGLDEAQLAHRSNKFFFGAPYLNGTKPSVFIGRGIYYRTKFQTYDIVNKKLQPRWSFDSGTGDYCGQGNHNYTIADVDNDGRDEITWGSMCVDDNGVGLYSTKMGHGDAMHVGDFDPYHKGQEVFSCLENSPVYGTLFREAATGKILHHYIKGSDCGRACAGNITNTYKGAELWGGGYGYSARDLTSLAHFGVAENYCIYWDGDILQEICDHRDFSTSSGVGYGTITKFNGYGNITTLLAADAYSCNWSKGTPCLQADIIGDWREEAIWRSTDNKALRIYITPYETQHRIYSLMHDHQYRQAIAWQMCGYNQPPHVSYFLGDSYTTPPPAVSTNCKLVWSGATSAWDKTSSNWKNNDTTSAYTDGKQVLFDVSSTNRIVELDEPLQPEVLTVSGPVDYTIGGTGTLSGNMHLDKLGSGTLTLNGNHNYTGTTQVWDGNLLINDTLSASPVWLNRFATLGGDGKVTDVTMEYGSVLYPGSNGIVDTLRLKGSLTMNSGAALNMDLTINPSATAIQNDYIIIEGNLVLGTSLTLQINPVDGSVSQGDYILAAINGNISGNLSDITVKGILGKKFNLVMENEKLILRIIAVRDASSVIWDGGTDGVWDVSATPNWLKDNVTDIFVYKDTVTFNDAATKKTVVLTGDLAPSYLKIDNSTLAQYFFNGTGKITGASGLYKTNTGTLTLNTRNDYTGATVIDGGTLIMKYAPTSTNNGGIGTNTTDPSKLLVSNGAIIRVATSGEVTDRGLTLGANGGVIDVPSQLTWNGSITGTTLTKTGAGLLILGTNNSNLNQTIITAGTVRMGTEAAQVYGPGKKVVFNGGSLELLNNTGSYSSCSFAMEVPTGITGTFKLDGRCEYSGALTGTGTLNLVTDYIRATLNGNWSAFEGNINVTANGGGDDFRIGSTSGYTKATINLGSGVSAYHTNGSQIVSVGMLTGVSDSYINGASWEVGAKGTNGIYAGVISTSGSVKKVGAGTWTLSGANTYTGGTVISGGILKVSNTTGSATGSGLVSVNNSTLEGAGGILSGTIMVNSGGILKGFLTLNGPVYIYNGGTLSPGSAFGTIIVNNNILMQAGSKLSIDVISSSGASDKLQVGTNKITLNGTLEITNWSGSYSEGNAFTIINGSNITGGFTSIVPETPGEGLVWDTTLLRSSGVISVSKSTGNKLISNDDNTDICVYPNPSNGKFNILLHNGMKHVTIIIENLNGIRLLSIKPGYLQNKTEVDLSAFPNGVYIVKVASDSKALLKKIVKN